jgi:hypothetical protein
MTDDDIIYVDPKGSEPNIAALDRIQTLLADPTARDLLNVGKVGEAIVAALHPDWSRARRGQPGYDFTTPNGQRVEVKCCGTEDRTHDLIHNTADRLIRIRLSPDGRWQVETDEPIPPGLFPPGSTTAIIGRWRRVS